MRLDHKKTIFSPIIIRSFYALLEANQAHQLLEGKCRRRPPELEEQRKPLIITQNGEAKAVLQDVASYEETQETLALLKILALGSQQVERGEVTPVSEVAKRLRSKATAA